MMTTKEKILTAALKLFNDEGIDKITVRHIAAEIGISHGNLCYHFHKKEDIIFALYMNLVDEMSQHLKEATSLSDFSLKILFQFSRKSFETLYKYKFLLLDLVAITRKVAGIKEEFTKLELQRKQEFMMGFQVLNLQGYFKEPIVEKQLDVFVEQLFLISNFWISESEVLYRGQEEDKVDHYAKLAFALAAPLLSEKGLKELDEIL